MWNLKFNIWFSKNYLNQNLGLDWTFKEGEWITADHANMHFVDINQTYSPDCTLPAGMPQVLSLTVIKQKEKLNLSQFM